jgi:hypothetical protein
MLAYNHDLRISELFLVGDVCLPKTSTSTRVPVGLISVRKVTWSVSFCKGSERLRITESRKILTGGSISTSKPLLDPCGMAAYTLCESQERLRSLKPKLVYESAPNRSVRPTTTKQPMAASLSTKFCDGVRPTMPLRPTLHQSLWR